jgi:hypothetical protein
VSWFALHCGNAVQHCPLEILFHQGSDGSGESRIHRYREVQRTHLQLRKRRYGDADAAIAIEFRIVAFFGRSECSLYGRVVVKERKENGDAFDDGCAELGFDAAPVMIEPALNRFQLFALAGKFGRRGGRAGGRGATPGFSDSRMADMVLVEMP